MKKYKLWLISMGRKEKLCVADLISETDISIDISKGLDNLELTKEVE